MIEVSEKFKEAIYAPSRKTHAVVRFEILDLTAYIDNIKTTPEEEIFSKAKQLTNKVRTQSLKIATFEKDYFKLDGSFNLPPNANNKEEIGYYSKNLSDEEGVFYPSEKIIFNFNETHSSIGLTIAFDVLNNEYASEFNIYVYDENRELLKRVNVTNNTKSIYELIEQLDNYKRIDVEIIKWCKPYRRCKVVEVDFGIIEEHNDESLISFNLIQELDNISSSLPSDELKFVVDNSNRRFNMLNKDGFYNYVKQGQEVFLDIGVEIGDGIYEDIQVGKYFLKTQQSDEGTLTATFTARDILDSLSNDETENLSNELNLSLYDFAKRILNNIGISNYKLSNNLKLIMTKGLYEKVTYRNLIQMIAIAGMCVVYSDNEGYLNISQLVDAKTVLADIEATNTEIIGNKNQIMNNISVADKKYLTFEKDYFKLDGSFNLPEKNKETGWVSKSLSNDEGRFEEELKITFRLDKEQTGNAIKIIFDTLNNEYATEFTIKTYNSLGEELLNDTIMNTGQVNNYESNGLVGAIEIQIILNKWCKPYRRARIYEVSFNSPVDNITFDNIYKEPQVVVSDIVKTVEVTYYPSDLENPVVLTYNDENLNTGSIMKLDNYLINTEEQAINVAKWIIKENNDNVNTFTVNWRGNPMLGVADRITIQNGFDSTNLINVTKQELNYEGYLSGRLEGKGVV
ncbi:conserved hypothetical protein [Clostridium neonatale]|nr:conserved hypothetical protein [Clostridium neonatale]